MVKELLIFSKLKKYVNEQYDYENEKDFIDSKKIINNSYIYSREIKVFWQRKRYIEHQRKIITLMGEINNAIN